MSTKLERSDRFKKDKEFQEQVKDEKAQLQKKIAEHQPTRSQQQVIKATEKKQLKQE